MCEQFISLQQRCSLTSRVLRMYSVRKYVHTESSSSRVVGLWACVHTQASTRRVRHLFFPAAAVSISYEVPIRVLCIYDIMCSRLARGYFVVSLPRALLFHTSCPEDSTLPHGCIHACIPCMHIGCFCVGFGFPFLFLFPVAFVAVRSHHPSMMVYHTHKSIAPRLFIHFHFFLNYSHPPPVSC